MLARLFRSSLIVLALATIYGSALSGRQHSHALTVTVTETAMAFGDEFVPRYSTAYHVPAGETQTFPQAFVQEHLEIAGTAILPDHFSLSVRTLLVFPGGTLQCQDGTTPTSGTIAVLDYALDLGSDPSQLGTGIVSAGTFRCVGPAKTGYARLNDDVLAGATTLPIVTPDDWLIGDQVRITDSRPMGWNGTAWESPRRDGTFAIVAKTPTSITLSGPLTFDRLAIREPDGELVTRAVVQNETRALRIVSRAPSGTRGHLMFVGDQAAFQVDNVEVRGLGRTCNGTLDEVTCRVGRYAFHAHMMGDGAGSYVTGSVFIGASSTVKWGGPILHRTNNVLVAGNVVTDTNGWGFGTEEGTEQGNQFLGNLCSYVAGNAVANQPDGVETNFATNRPGTEGSCFGLRGINNRIEGNEAWNSAIGFNLLSILRFVANVEQGADRFVFRGNRDFSHRLRGQESWGVRAIHPIEDHTAAYSGETQIWHGGAGTVHPSLVNPRVICAPARGEGIHGNGAYVAFLTIRGGEVRGCAFGIGNGVANIEAQIDDVTFQNVTNLDMNQFAPYELRLENVTHEPLGAFPKRGIVLPEHPPWQPGDNVGGASYVNWARQRGPQWTVTNHQGIAGLDFDLLAPSQHGGAPAWYGTGETAINLVPEIGLTMREAYAKYCQILRGDYFEDADTDEWVIGVARPVSKRPTPCGFGVVITSPSRHAPAPTETFNLYAQLTGPYNPAVRQWCIGHSGGQYCSSIVSVEDTMTIPRVTLPQGTHTWDVWRLDASGQEISGSRRTQSFCVVACEGGEPPPPPPPATPNCTTSDQIVDALGHVWTFSPDRPASATLRDGQPIGFGQDRAAPYTYTWQDGWIYVETDGNDTWWRFSGADAQAASWSMAARPSCAGELGR